MKVKNRMAANVVYEIPEDHITRFFTAGEVKNIDKEEMVKLSYQAGGLTLIRDCFLMDDREFVEECFSGNVEPEYWYDVPDVEALMTSGSIEEFEDCLDFAPLGVLEIIKDKAVTMPLNDVEKINAIKNTLGFDVLKAIELSKDEEKPATEKKTRRTSTTEKKTSAPKTRRTSATKAADN